jgi:anti-sigma-K factor RskA
MVHDDYKEMIPARALSALDAAEDRVMSEHLSECEECRRELAQWEATAATLALSAAPVEPSPDVRQRILSQIHSDQAVLPFIPKRRSVWNSLGSLGAIAAVVLFIALIVSVIVLWQQNRRLRQENEFVQLLNSPGSKVAQLTGTNQAAGATAKLVYDKNGHARLVASGLPRAPQGKEYQLWFIVGNKPPVPGKTFAPDNSGSGTLTDHVPETARDEAVFAITLEPAGGVAAPTGAIYLSSGK